MIQLFVYQPRPMWQTVASAGVLSQSQGYRIISGSEESLEFLLLFYPRQTWDMVFQGFEYTAAQAQWLDGQVLWAGGQTHSCMAQRMGTNVKTSILTKSLVLRPKGIVRNQPRDSGLVQGALIFLWLLKWDEKWWGYRVALKKSSTCMVLGA